MKDKLCQAFCDDLKIQTVPAGLAVTTAFASSDGDHIGFYIVKDGDTYRIEDDGAMLPHLEASGLDFRSGTRGEAMRELLAEYGVKIDDEAQEFHIEKIKEAGIASAALKFVAFSLRVRETLKS